MSDDASLSDFAGRDGDEAGDGSTVDDPTDDAPATPTYTYTSTPDGAACAACGESVETRWRAGEGGAADETDLDPDALVCPDCKEW
ncbi:MULTISPECIES: DUF7573 domain-containing protein [Halolamina]|uniref:DUF7573 domain-containing protein n=1 Tax=Halolamina pelagica TaxID=699431 RepID=A0A1I5PY30_9EURY|nr:MULTISPECIES: hypothetical protein [Halolamina]SFP38759.1 hypothetical protein SAMN05216277_103155 [Halolamina pelagica]